MDIRYDGPGSFVNVPPFGEHAKGQVKAYPDDFGSDLIQTSKRQWFTVIEKAPVEKKRSSRAGAKRKPKPKGE